MAETSKLRTREIVIAVGFIVVFAITMWFVLRTYKEEGDKRSVFASPESLSVAHTSASLMRQSDMIYRWQH
jgi:hypothetical protein